MRFITSGLLSLCLFLGLASDCRGQDLVDTAISAGSFKTLVAALGAAELVDALKGEGPFTVFAPSDAAFEKLPKGTVATLLEPANREQLKMILLYHVVPSKVLASAAVNLRSATTLSGQRLNIAFEAGRLKIDDSTVSKSDLVCSNGVIHVVDRVLLPEVQSILELGSASADFKTLSAAIKSAGLVEALSGKGPFTVFAPTDAAFSKLPKGTVEKLLRKENRQQLVDILKYHVIAGRAFSADALQLGEAKTLSGKKLRFAFGDSGLRVNDSQIVSADIDAANGVIHVIDTVLLPPREQGRRKLIGVHVKTASSKQRKLLALESGEGLQVTSLVTGYGAEQSGLQSHDVIIGIDGEPATSKRLTAAKAARQVGETIRLKIVREVEVPVRQLR